MIQCSFKIGTKDPFMESDEKMAAGKTEEAPAQGASSPGKQSSLADWAPKLVGLLIPVALGLEAYGVYASRVDKAEAASVEAAKLQSVQQEPARDQQLK